MASINLESLIMDNSFSEIGEKKECTFSPILHAESTLDNNIKIMSCLKLNASTKTSHTQLSFLAYNCNISSNH